MSNERVSTIKEWAVDERPREKMLQKGPAALTDAELLAILIGSGIKSRSAVDVGRDILKQVGNDIHKLGRLSVAELQKTKGVGAARSIVIAAALELGKRRQERQAREVLQFSRSREAADLLIPMLTDLNHEVFYTIYLNQACHLLSTEMIGQGGITSAAVDVRIILKHALLCGATQVILAHNHPSGSLNPSQADKDLTQRVKSAAAVMDIRVLDHIIVGGRAYLSMADEGLL